MPGIVYQENNLYVLNPDAVDSTPSPKARVAIDRSIPVALSDGHVCGAMIAVRNNQYGFFLHYHGNGYGSNLYASRMRPCIFREMKVLASFNSSDFVGYIAGRHANGWSIYRIAESGDPIGDNDLCEKLNKTPCADFAEAKQLATKDRFYNRLVNEFGGKWVDVKDYIHSDIPIGLTLYESECEVHATRYIRRWYTPEHITRLKQNQIFVFGSNPAGAHYGGAARAAWKHFRAVMGESVGRTGQCYAIPTMHGGIEEIRPYVDAFIAYAADHPELEFLVTPIGCGIAGFTPATIAPLFHEALRHGNIILPRDFVEPLTAGCAQTGRD